MSRAQPWFRKSDNWWYVQIGKKQHRLAKGPDAEKDARQAWHRLMSCEGLVPLPGGPDPAYFRLADAFLSHVAANRAPKTYKWYSDYLNDFCGVYVGTVLGLRPAIVEDWIGSKAKWGRATRRGAVVSIKRSLNWALERDLITVNPLKRLKRPPAVRRSAYITQERHRAILAATKSTAFKDVLNCMWWSACRPQEIRAVEARHVNLELGIWEWSAEEAPKRTGRVRRIVLDDKALRLTRILVGRHPEGPIFRNDAGEPWTAQAILCRFRRYREAGLLPKGFSAYAYRHGAATRLLASGSTAHDVATVLGHSSTTMVDEHYSHLAEEIGHLRKRLEAS